MSGERPEYDALAMRARAEIRVLAVWSILAAILICLPARALLRQSILVDDTFYALAAARHLAAGDGSTVDGLHPTNGYQPLWVWILAGITAAARLGPDGTVRAALILCALATGAAGILAAGIVRDLGGSERAAGWAAALWLLNPYLLKRQFNGLEAALAALLLLAFLRAAIALQRGRGESGDWEGGGSRAGGVESAGRSGWRRNVEIGALAGLCGLARIELGVLAALLAIRRRFLAAAVGAAIIAPWLAWSRLRYGSWVPLSGEATRVWYAVMQGLPPGSPPAWDPENAALALAWLLGLGWPAAALSRAGFPRAWVWVVAPAALALLWLVVRAGGDAEERIRGWLGSIRPLAFWTGALALYLWAAYAIAFPAPWHLNRYYLPLHALWVVWAALFYDRVVRVVRDPGDGEAELYGSRLHLRLWGFACAVVFLFGLAPYAVDTAHGRSPAAQLEVARWLRERVPEDVGVGVVQSGVVGYYAGRPVINLDGKVNPEAMRALRQGKVWDYLAREEILLFGDWSDLVESLFERAGSPRARERVRHLPEGMGPPGPFTFYRLIGASGPKPRAPTPPLRAASPGPTGPRAW